MIFNPTRVIKVARAGDGVISDTRPVLFLFKKYYLIKRFIPNP
jgi:hypothetical protein